MERDGKFGSRLDIFLHLSASASEIINKGRNYGWTIFSLSSLWEAKDFLNTARLAIMQIATMTAYAGATSPELLRTFLAT